MNNEASLGCRLTRPQFLRPWPFPFSCGHLLAICPPLPHIKQWTHVELLAKQSWHLFDLNLLPSFGKLCLLVLLSNFISFARPWRLFSCFCMVFNNSVSASSSPALLLLGSLNKFSSHSSGTDLLKFYMFTLSFHFWYFAQTLRVSWRCLTHSKNKVFIWCCWIPYKWLYLRQYALTA